MLETLRRPLVGDFLASMFVGWALLLGYEHLHDITGLPVAISYLIPLLVYCFSAIWNRCSCSKLRALITALVMGTFFVGVHHAPLPHWIMSAAGFAAPVAVSWWARKSARSCRLRQSPAASETAVVSRNVG
jgi:hypothetical protein